MFAFIILEYMTPDCMNKITENRNNYQIPGCMIAFKLENDRIRKEVVRIFKCTAVCQGKDL